jgi:hypothetical protein
MQMRDELNRRRRAEEDVGVVRDLCAKLDTQKDTLMQQVTESDRIKMQVMYYNCKVTAIVSNI